MRRMVVNHHVDGACNVRASLSNQRQELLEVNRIRGGCLHEERTRHALTDAAVQRYRFPTYLVDYEFHRSFRIVPSV